MVWDVGYVLLVPGRDLAWFFYWGLGIFMTVNTLYFGKWKNQHSPRGGG